ncbi:mortality factor 4-like protein 1 [Meriones unguiculatus]|uniref:mortality factor 4-like protein 1 n=1 Tax=Meriones unguiculatus TaxID=10047 RepID=UPI00293E3056|nr:mortality factor 4-like protein 1 [Meriones unguiculatus]
MYTCTPVEGSSTPEDLILDGHEPPSTLLRLSVLTRELVSTPSTEGGKKSNTIPLTFPKCEREDKCCQLKTERVARDARPLPLRLAALSVLIRTQWAAQGAAPTGQCRAASAVGLSHLGSPPGGGPKSGGAGGQSSRWVPWSPAAPGGPVNDRSHVLVEEGRGCIGQGQDSGGASLEEHASCLVGLPESRLLTLVDNNLLKKTTLRKQFEKTSKSKQKTPGNGDGGSSSKMPQPPRKKRARAVATVESEEALKKRVDVEVEVKIPEELKPWLVEDWDLVTRQKQLFQLPAKENVDAILEEYANCTKSHGRADNKEYAVDEVVGGIKKYFNVMLGTQLLYEFERPQYAEILLAHPDVPVSHIYGAPHLLRLFVRIGAMLAYKPLGEKRAVLANTPFDEHSLPLVLGYLHDFLKYLAKNSASLFTASDYKVASAEYHLKAL